ncbi:MAG: hypothetical protein Tsb0019_16150 [Roseibium sp.]
MTAEGPTRKDFWSRRKEAVRKAEEAEQERQQEELEAAQRAALEEKSDEDILEELGLPEPESLGKDDDFTRFLSKTVPERLRRRALRRLWLTNPVLANLDGLNDYEEDFTDAATASQVVRTAYQVGRGFLKSVTEEPQTVEAPAAEAGELPAGEGGPVSAQQEISVALQHTYDENGKTSIRLTQRDDRVQSDDTGDRESVGTEYVDAPDERSVRRRRMRFDYD